MHVASAVFHGGRPLLVYVRSSVWLTRIRSWLLVHVRSSAHRVVAHRGNQRRPCGQPVVRMGGAVRDYPALTPHTCPAVAAAHKAGAS